MNSRTYGWIIISTSIINFIVSIIILRIVQVVRQNYIIMHYPSSRLNSIFIVLIIFTIIQIFSIIYGVILLNNKNVAIYPQKIHPIYVLIAVFISFILII